MSSLGRPNPSIDLVNILNDRVQTLEDNIGEPSSQDILDENENVLQEGTDASGLNLDVEVLQREMLVVQDEVLVLKDEMVVVQDEVSVLQDEVLVLQDQVGSDDVDPKTGIFLRLFDIEKADTIIPHYDVRGFYYDIVNKTYEIESDDPNYESANIVINNLSKKNLNEIILNMQRDISKLNKSNHYFRSMLGQSG